MNSEATSENVSDSARPVYQRTFLRRLLPVLLLFGCVAYLIYSVALQSEKRLVEKHERKQLELAHSVISRELQTVYSDLEALLAQASISSCVAPSGGDAKAEAAKAIRAIPDVAANYDQVQVLDSTGMEVVCVTFKDGSGAAVPDSDLRNMAHHYTFANTYELSNDQLFISAFDLKVENGAVVEPWEPVLRFGRLLHDESGNKSGVLVLRYRGRPMLWKLFRLYEQTGNQCMLLDRDGYWLKGPSPEDEWGFMLKGRDKVNYENRFPEEWPTVRRFVSGQFYTEAGLVTFLSVYPLREMIHSDSVGEHRLGWLRRKRYTWKMVSHVDNDQIVRMTADTRKRFLRTVIVTALIMAAAIADLIASRRRRAA